MKLKSIWEFGMLKSEETVLEDMAAAIHQLPSSFTDDLVVEGLRSIPGIVYDLTKDALKARVHNIDGYKVRSRIYSASRNRAMFVSSKGYIGLAPWNAKAGDAICVLLGGCTPFLLRPVRRSYALLGEAYVYGIMGGELLKPEMGHARLRNFEIV
jgi:hypothetical protein